MAQRRTGAGRAGANSRRHAAGIVGGAGAGGSDPDEEFVEELSGTDAASQLITEWFAEPPVALEDSPLDIAFDAPMRIELEVAAPPPRRAEDGAGSNALSGESTSRQACDTYALTAQRARGAHDYLIGLANRNARRVLDEAGEAIGRLDLQLQPTLDRVGTTMDLSRRDLDVAVSAAQALLEAEARAARGRASAAAATGRAAVSAASRRAVQVELPRLRTELRGDFVSLYGQTADSIAASGKKTSDTLHSPAAHNRWLEDSEYNDTGKVQERAAKEAARPEIPPRMDKLGDTLKAAADRNAEQIRARLDTAPPNGGQSIGAGIDSFVQSLRRNITGDAAGAAASAFTRGLGSGGPITAAVEGLHAFTSTASAGSLETRGHTAIARSYSEALRSLNKQLRAAKAAVRHARRSGLQQLATQRAGALTRLADLRKRRVEALRETALQAAKALRGGAKSAVTFYGESTRRFAQTLRRAAGRGPAALAETTKQGLSPVTNAIADGQKLQTGRLEEIARSAERSATRLSGSVASDARGASAEFERIMGEVDVALGGQVDGAASAHSRHFAEVVRGVVQTTHSFTQPLPSMFKRAIDDTKGNLRPILDAETTRMKDTEKSIADNDDALARDPTPQLGERWRAAKKERDENLGNRAQAMRNAWGMITLDEDALMANARGVTRLGGASISEKFPGDLYGRLESEHEATLGGLNDDEYNAIINYLAGRTAEGAYYELRTTVHWYGNEGDRATKIMEDIGSEARRSLTGRADWGDLAKDVRDGLHGTDRNVFDALVMDRAALAQAYRARDAVDDARRRNDRDALFTALTPYQGDVIRDGRVVSAEEQLAEFDREFAVVLGKAQAPNDISQQDAARAVADYATRPVTVMVEEGHGEHSRSVERTYTLSGPDTALARALAMHGPNDEETRAARLLSESERSGKPNLEALENAVIDPRLNPALTPDLKPEDRQRARAEQDRLFTRYAQLAREYGVHVEGNTPQELRAFVAGRLDARYGDSDNDRLGARYAKSIVLNDRPDPVAAVRYATERSGTDVGLLRRTFGRMSRDEIKQLARDYEKETGEDLYSMLGVYGHSGGELSGDERIEIERLMMGVPRNDRERAEVALYQNLQQQRETGVAGRAALAGSIEERRLLAAEGELRQVMGGSIEYDEFGRPVQHGGSFDQRGRYSGPNDTGFLLAVNRATMTAESYSAAIDRLSSVITTIISVVGAVVAAVLTVVTGGLAAPLMIAALSFGLAGMAANSLIRGGRYGWEEALTDLGMVGVQVLTAGLGAQLGAAARAANTAAAAARAGGTAVAKVGLARLFTGNPLIDQIMIGAITGGVGGVGQSALQAETWRDGLFDGIGNTLLGGLRGSLAGAATSAATNAVEALPVSRGALAAMRVGEDYRSLGSEIGRLSAGGGPLRATLNIAGRSVARGGLQAVGGVAGRSTELAFDAARGKYHGNLTEALGEIGEAGLRSGLQGLAEGGGEAFGQRHRDAAHPLEALEREQHRMRVIENENSALRGGLHADTVRAALAPELPAAGRAPPTADTPIAGRAVRATSEGEPIAGAAARPTPAAAGEGVEPTRIPTADEAARMIRPAPSESDTAAGERIARRPVGAEEDLRSGRLAVARHDGVEGAAARVADSEMQLAPHAVIDDPQAALSRAVPEVIGERGPLRGCAFVDEADPGPGVRVLLERADGEAVWVRIVVGETEGGDIASFGRAGSGDDHFVVTLSRRARETTHARALAHELEELRFHRSPTAAAPVSAREADLLRSSRALSDSESRLSPHDRGRLAELQWLAEQIRAARVQQDAAGVVRLQGEVDALAAHLGLLHADSSDPRMVRALAALPESGQARAELDQARLRAATPGVDDALHPARGLPEDARLSPADRRRLSQFDETAAELAHARRAGDREAIFRLTRALVDQAEGMGLLSMDALADRRAALAHSALEASSGAGRALDEIRARFATHGGGDALRPGLTPDVRTVLSQHDRAQLAELDQALVRLHVAEQGGEEPHMLAQRRHDAESLAASLGLVHGSGADARAALATTALGDTATGVLGGVRVSARENPLLRPRMGTLEDLPLLAQQIRHANEMGDARLATELTEIAMLRLREAGATGTDRPLRASARAEIERIVGVDPAARLLVTDAAERQSARQRADLLHEAVAGVRGDLADARQRLRAAQSTRERVAPGVLRRSDEEAGIRREIDALERRAVALDEAAGRAERIAFRPAGAAVDAALVASSDDVMFSIAPRLRHDPDYPGNPNTVRLVNQQYGDSPQFQSWNRFRDLYYESISTKKPFFGVHGHDTDHIERVIFGRWRSGQYVSETTRGVRMLGEVDRILAEPPVPVPPGSGATRVLADSQSLPVRVRTDDGQLAESTMTVTEAEDRRRELIGTRNGRQRELDATNNPQRRRELQSDINELTARINDVSEALGVAAGRAFVRERFGNEEFLTEAHGSGVPDLLYEDPTTKRITVIECKGGTSELGARRATSEGRTVLAEQTTPEYLRSLAEAMIRNPETESIGRKIIDALNEIPPSIDVFVVRQPFEDGGNRGTIEVEEYPVLRSGR